MNLTTSSDTLDSGASATPSYYQRHIFFCLNQRDNGEACCAQYDAQAAFDRCKVQVKAAGLAGPGQVRVNKAGCLDRCAAGPVAVVYPEAVWYSYVDASDIDEIVQSHLKNGQVVDRLLVPAHLGR
jgi:(2Fe-2S) ferredoxin